jgi:hypothetical protein
MCAKASKPTPPLATLEVTLDGQPIRLPAERRSLNAIRCYLETLALERQRILFTFTVDGGPARSARPNGKKVSFTRVEGETVDLTDMPVHLLETALQQTADARELVEKAVALVLINGGCPAQEFWWEMARKLKEPLVTLSLLPESLCGSTSECAAPMKLRRWQLQQLAAIIKDVDQACWSPDSIALSNALENRALPWLDRLHESITLQRATVLAGARCRAAQER